MELIVLNKNFETEAYIDNYRSLIWTDRLREAGEFELYMDLDSNNIEHLQLDYYLVMSETDHVMIIEKIEVTSDPDDGELAIYTGRSLESILDRRILSIPGNTGSSITYSRGTSLGDIMKALLNENIISPSSSMRKISNFIQSISSSATSAADREVKDGDNLYDTITAFFSDIEEDADDLTQYVGFKIVLNSSDQFVFYIINPKDFSWKNSDSNATYILISEKEENLDSMDYINDLTSYKNKAFSIAGDTTNQDGSEKTPTGAGFNINPIVTGSGGTFDVRGDLYSGLDLREVFIDGRSITVDWENSTGPNGPHATSLRLYYLIRENAENYVKEQSATGSFVIPDYLRYGEDYYLGDTIQLQFVRLGLSVVARITEMTWSIDDTGVVKVYPTFTIINDTISEASTSES